MISVMGEEGGKSLVVPLIERAVESTERIVDLRLLKAIKSRVRDSDSELRHAAQTLMNLMKSNHSQVRYLAILIIDELFVRSKLFRTLIIEDLDQLIRLGVGIGRNAPLPRPELVASLLHSKSIEILETWTNMFGAHYRRLRLGYNYLKNTCRIRFPEMHVNAGRIAQQTRERQRIAQEIRLKKFLSFKEKFPSIKESIQSTIDEIDECLGIASKGNENMQLASLDDEDEFEHLRGSELQRIRLSSLREGDRVQESTENKVVFDALRESFKVLVTKHLPAVHEWTSLLIRVEVEDTSFRDSALKELIDIRNLIHATKEKCEEEGVELSKKSDAEDDIWEDGATMRSYENNVSDPGCSRSIDELSAAAANNARNKGLCDKSSNGNVQTNQLKSKLMTEAPVLEWGSSLDTWGSSSDVLANQRGLDVDNHWGRVDQDATIPAERIAERNVQASLYEEQPIEIPSCRAPLRKGALCERRDLKICPFHGRIIPRDEEGNPVGGSSKRERIEAQNQAEECTSDEDGVGELAQELLKQAVKNVRERDGEEGLHRRLSIQTTLKKEKLAKIRKHNEDVLRDAAIASTWRSSYVGEEVETGSGSGSSRKRKKETLSSMLRKKSTAKNRIAGRLSKL